MRHLGRPWDTDIGSVWVHRRTGDDQYRKPCTAAWKFMESQNGSAAIVRGESYFVGDAAGRPAGGGRSKDHGASDWKFAINLGLPFYTPQDFFTSYGKSVEGELGFDPRTIGSEPRPLPTKEDPADEAPRAEVLLLVGAPGSGKTHIARSAFKTHEWINQDTLKRREKCLSVCEVALKQGRSAIIDCQNATRAKRADFVALAKKHGVSQSCPNGIGVVPDATARAIHIAVPKGLCFHLNRYRQVRRLCLDDAGCAVPAVREGGRQAERPGAGDSRILQVRGTTQHRRRIHLHRNYCTHKLRTRYEDTKDFVAPTGPFRNDADRELFFMFLE
eukprot:Polyplicarium_translucidae@DN2541_c0_g1_i4.p1